MPKEMSREKIRQNPLALWVGRAIQFWQDHRALILGIFAALIVAGGSLAGYAWRRAQQAREGDVVLEKAQAALQGQKPSTPGNAEEAKKLFEEVITRFPGTVAAQEALIRLGNMQYDGGKYGDAIMSYGKYLSTYPKGPFRMLAGIGKAYAEEAKGELPAAEKTLSDTIEKTKNDPLAGEAYSDLARLYEESKKPEDAIRVYGQIVERFPQTRWAQHALQRMSMLKVK
jgi:outer membrane protein assembly factor BamD (BamD/ComL family)